MEKDIIVSNDAPVAIGPYAQANAWGNMVFCSGQIPLDPQSGQIVPGDIKDQTRQCLENLGAVLKAAGAGLETVLKTTVFLADMADFSKFNEVYQEYFTGNYPARSTVQVAALPRAALVEIEAVAIRP